MAEKPSCYTVKDIQEILGVSRPVVYKLLKTEQFRYLMIGEKYLIPKKAFDDWFYGNNDSVL